MSKLKIVALLGLATFVAACGARDEEVVMSSPAPVYAEPVTTKY